MFDNSEMNHKDHMNWLVESGACQLDEIEMPPPPDHSFSRSIIEVTKSTRAAN